jgi:hypothetical protein
MYVHVQVRNVDSKLDHARGLVADYKTRISRNNFCKMLTVINCLLIVLIITFLVLSSRNSDD